MAPAGAAAARERRARTLIDEAMPLDETSRAWHHGDEQLIGMILDRTLVHAVFAPLPGLRIKY